MEDEIIVTMETLKELLYIDKIKNKKLNWLERVDWVSK